MNRIHVSFSVEVPEPASEEQVREWVEFELGRSSIKGANPLSKCDIEAAGHISIRREDKL